MKKVEIRKAYKIKRNQLSLKEIDALSNEISTSFLNNFEVINQVIHLFSSIEKFREVDTSEIKKHLFENNITVVTSVMHYSPFSLSHSIITSETQYHPDNFNIPTPDQITPVKESELDIVLVPLLSFDKDGYRVGYGKGIYDEFLSKCSPSCKKVGVSFFPPINKIEDTHKSDVQLDFCITPDKLYQF